MRSGWNGSNVVWAGQVLSGPRSGTQGRTRFVFSRRRRNVGCHMVSRVGHLRRRRGDRKLEQTNGEEVADSMAGQQTARDPSGTPRTGHGTQTCVGRAGPGATITHQPSTAVSGRLAGPGCGNDPTQVATARHRV